jgi:hypothetical protein
MRPVASRCSTKPPSISGELPRGKQQMPPVLQLAESEGRSRMNSLRKLFKEFKEGLKKSLGKKEPAIDPLLNASIEEQEEVDDHEEHEDER